MLTNNINAKVSLFVCLFDTLSGQIIELILMNVDTKIDGTLETVIVFLTQAKLRGEFSLSMNEEIVSWYNIDTINVMGDIYFSSKLFFFKI